MTFDTGIIYSGKAKRGGAFHLSLFSGIGTTEQACKDAGLADEKTDIICSELNPHAWAILKKNHPNALNIGDATKIDYEKLYSVYGTPELITGGFPCNEFASVNKSRKGFDGKEKGNLVCCCLAAVYYARKMGGNPKWCFENVMGMSQEQKATINALLLNIDNLPDYVDLDTLQIKPEGLKLRSEVTCWEITNASECTIMHGGHVFFSNASRPGDTSEIFPKMTLREFFNTITGVQLLKCDKSAVSLTDFINGKGWGKASDRKWETDEPNEKFMRRTARMESDLSRHMYGSFVRNAVMYEEEEGGQYSRFTYGINRADKRLMKGSKLFHEGNDKEYRGVAVPLDAVDWIMGFPMGYTDIGEQAKDIDKNKKTLKNEGWLMESKLNNYRWRGQGGTYTVHQMRRQLERLYEGLKPVKG